MGFTVNINLTGGLNLNLIPAVPAPLPSFAGRMTFHVPPLIFSGVAPMATTIPVDTPPVSASVQWVDLHQNPAQVDGATTWASSDETIMTVVADSTDSTKATITVVGALGTAQLTATADADLGAGMQNIVAMTDVTTIAGEAVAGTITIQLPVSP